ncbi:MAG: hypothetical protein UU88_C0013G0012 [Parcubacteria group bacterium GW2011_GWC1_42_11]|uniref:DUF397 domain-containing protein n=1 Tax=Candidatus Nomurabacteria bacterium GW2011_GWC2_42_20 TaxID=1618756 RepID=A0A0G1BKU9_9BACT|nr:MAG: hypothetical protein UU88_C0013G0012 [Parcubacteria group bacterium GW2011_GWC1_42_11]KKS46911.1 MAG: hypothetical protein UV12_C0015G0005 [Candidatus Nomurabacteria bacterium GW2011_GWC2_42_20]KKS58916.1 MAG: hypothetical protein UV24_C0012G0003 [Candidatus Nomurabacteria bacterium GW2011_GWA2_42_41]KKT08128.1 MAG: hypothetical protein UV86_C0023G0003 [Candidatus Nomurabacteria bacterium GW2011_GWB1_43_20]
MNFWISVSVATDDTNVPYFGDFIMKNVFGNGCPFTVKANGQKVDEDGFVTSSLTYITNRRTCVSVKIGDGHVQVRDTKDASKTALTFSPDEWRAFVGGVKNGEFDL